MKKAKSKRAVADIPIFLDDQFFSQLQLIVESIKWPYKTMPRTYWTRDHALASTLILTGLRVSEALALHRSQLRDYPNRILLVNVHTLKHGLTRQKIVCPKTGRLAPFTHYLEKWLLEVPEDEDACLFPRGSPQGFQWHRPLSRYRAFWIIKTSVNRFPHWFRSVTETIYGRLVFKSDAWKLKDFMGLRRLDSTTPYVKGSWEDNEADIYTL